MCLTAFLGMYLYGAVSFNEKQNDTIEEYKGVIKVWDIATTTIKGSKYSFMNTILSEFCENYSNLRLEFYKIPSTSDEQAIEESLQSASGPDVIRSDIKGYDTTNDGVLLISDEFKQELNSYYNSAIKNDYGNQLIVDVHCNASVILVNKDLLDDIGVDMPAEKLDPDGFISFLETIQEKSEGKCNTLGMRNDNKYIIPFYFINGAENPDYEYFDRLCSFISDETIEQNDADAVYSFYNGQTAVFCADLNDVNYLLRKQMNSDGFDFEIMLYPSNTDDFIYINEITSYVFYESSNEAKNEMLRRFALYLLGYEAQKYTENIGMLPCASVDIDYKLYGHLDKLTDSNLIVYTCRDEFVKGIMGED